MIIAVGIILIWRKAVAAIHIVAMKLYWCHSNLADRRKSPNRQIKITAKYTAYMVVNRSNYQFLVSLSMVTTIALIMSQQDMIVWIIVIVVVTSTYYACRSDIYNFYQ